MSKDHSPNHKSFETIAIDRPTMNNTPNPSGDQALLGFDLSAIKVTSDKKFPLELDIISETQNILASGVFKYIESPILYDKLCDMMLSDRYSSLVETLFWTIFVVKFQKDDQDLLESLRKHLGHLYSEYFSLLEQPKEELSNLGIFGAAYTCQIMFFNLFPKERELFDMRFILDCYHIVIHEVNGIFVSDFYIQTSIERFFGNKFFHYEKRAEKKKKVEKKDFRNEPLLRNLKYNLKNLPQVPGGLDLAHELASKLRRGPKKSKNGVSMISGLDDSHHTKHNISNILKLTQPNEDKSFMSNGEGAPYFPKLKFNCHQISPTVSSFLENSNNTLPFKKRKVICYSNNQHLSDNSQLIYQPNFDMNYPKSEKKDKKNHFKGTVSDYNLKNRTEDYYLGYMPKDIKARHRQELDMKYIMDHIKPTLRGSHSIKELIKEAPRKLFPIKDSHTTNENPIYEEQEEEGKEYFEGFSIEKEDNTLLPESPDEPKESFMRTVKEENGDNLSQDMRRTHTNSESILPLLKSKLKASIAPELNKTNSFKKRFFQRKDDSLSKSRQAEEDFKKSVMPERLRFTHAANKNLGKGRFFVNLAEREEDQDLEHERRFGKKVLYEDKRKKYIREHDSLIKKDVDSNIDNLVRSLIMKKSTFNKSFGRVSDKRA